MPILRTICIVSLALVAYSYIGYPLLLIAYARLRAGQRRSAGETPPPESWPTVSLIVAAYREETVIVDRIRNALALDYPPNRLEILIGCDGDEDRTGELVRAVNDPRVRLQQFPRRRGKPSVLNDCATQARGEILVLTDANTFFDREALKHLVRHFSSAEVGGVVGQLVLGDPASGSNLDGRYWRVETMLKRCEGEIGALLGANGAIYAIRRSLWQPLAPHTIIDDFVVGMRVHLSGKRLLFEPQAVAREESAPTLQAEFQRRARIGAGGFQSLIWLAPLLHPRYGAVAWAFWSHKVLRWLTPLLLAGALAANLFLLSEPAFQALMLLQALGCAAAAVGLFVPVRSRWGRAFRLAWMFCAMNAALVVGFWRWLTNRQSAAWQRTARTSELRCQNEYAELR